MHTSIGEFSHKIVSFSYSYPTCSQGTGRDIEITKLLLNDSDGPIENHCLLMLDS